MMRGYFDHNATTPLHPAARAAWLEATDRCWQNPSSLYREAAAVKHRLEEARERLADLLGCDPGRVIFTSGATESNNALVRWLAQKSGPEAIVVSSSTEHPSLAEPLEHEFRGRVLKMPAHADTSLNLEAADRLIQPGNTALVTVMAANNESGTLNPWRDLTALCRARQVPYHCDASQWIGKLPLTGFGECDYLTGSAHKFGGPKGIGFLMVRDENERFHLARGGPQEEGRRAGTENYPAIEAMVTALEAVEETLDSVMPQQSAWRDAFETTLCSLIPGTRIVGQEVSRLWNTSLFVLPAHDHRKWLGRLSQAGFAVSTGSACSAGDNGASSVMQAIQAPVEEWRRVLRISGGWETTAEEWQALAEALGKVGAGL